MDGPRRSAEKASPFNSSIHTQNCPDPEDVAVVRMAMDARESHARQRKSQPDAMEGMKGAVPSPAGDKARQGPDLRLPSHVNKFTMLWDHAFEGLGFIHTVVTCTALEASGNAVSRIRGRKQCDCSWCVQRWWRDEGGQRRSGPG